jgi:hypothetical protein
VLDDLDRSLEQLLKRGLAPALVSQVTITFATPDAQFPPPSVTLPAVDLFLYDVRENRDLRSNEWIVERHSDGTAARQRAPTRLDCSYLITSWASASSNTPAQDEHHLLGEVIKVLLRYPTLPAQVLQGSLAGQPTPLPAISLQPGYLQNVADFWSALGGKPRPALNCTITVGVTPEPAAEAGPVVIDATLAIAQEG